MGVFGFHRFNVYGFEFTNGLRSSRGTWDQISDITDAIPYRPRLLWRPLSARMTYGTHCTLTGAGMYTASGSTLRDMMQFYWQHPEYRMELTQGRALERLRTTTEPASAS